MSGELEATEVVMVDFKRDLHITIYLTELRKPAEQLRLHSR
jgi:hypothetical protein